MAAQSWSVVATVDEPLAALCAFVAHYRALGAASITLCLDRPAALPEVQAAMDGTPGLRLVACDAGWWRGRRPLHSTLRQRQNATRIYRDTGTDWLLHVDADEFLWHPGNVGMALAALGPDWPVVRLSPAERVRVAEASETELFEGWFRLPRLMSLATLTELYGADACFFNGEGLLSHARGKCFTRTGLPLTIGVHQPFSQDHPDMSPADHRSWLDAVAIRLAAPLVHFDGFTTLHWLLKLVGRSEADRSIRARGRQIPAERHAPARLAQMQAVNAARGDPAALSAFATRLRSLDAARHRNLAARGLLLSLPIDPVTAARAQFPALDLDFTAAGFDAALRRARPELVALAGLSR